MLYQVSGADPVNFAGLSEFYVYPDPDQYLPCGHDHIEVNFPMDSTVCPKSLVQLLQYTHGADKQLTIFECLIQFFNGFILSIEINPTSIPLKKWTHSTFRPLNDDTILRHSLSLVIQNSDILRPFFSEEDPVFGQIRIKGSVPRTKGDFKKYNELIFLVSGVLCKL